MNLTKMVATTPQGGHYTAGTVGGDGVTIGLLTAVLDLSCSFWLTLVFQLFLV